MKTFFPYYKVSRLAFTVLLVTAPHLAQAECRVFCGSKVDSAPDQKLHINAVESFEQAKATERALSNLQVQMQTKMEEINRLVDANDTEATLSSAKALLDEVRVKTGIDPKVKMRESFLVSTTFPEGAASFADINETQKRQVIQTVMAFRGGLYMDIMNLSKRVSIIYTKAIKAQMDKQGGMDEQDRNKIIQDLVTATLVPMPIEDKSGKKIMAFDEDIANEDHTYMFNREIKKYLLQQTDLKMTEDSFEKHRQKVKQSLTPAAPVKTVEPSVYDRAFICVDNTESIPSFDTRNASKVSCFNKYLNAFQNHAQCSAIAGRISGFDAQNKALSDCARRFQ